MEKCFTIEHEQSGPKLNPKSVTEGTEGRTLPIKESAVNKTAKKFPGVSKEEDKRLESEVIKYDLDARDDDDLRKGRDEDNEYVPQSEVDDVEHNKPKLESSRLHQIRKVWISDRSERKKRDCSATKKLEWTTLRVWSMTPSGSKAQARLDGLATQFRRFSS